jgi:hypothetical protein
MDSARKSRMVAEASSSNTRLLFSLLGSAAETGIPTSGVLTPPPASTHWPLPL